MGFVSEVPTNSVMHRVSAIEASSRSATAVATVSGSSHLVSRIRAPARDGPDQGDRGCHQQETDNSTILAMFSMHDWPTFVVIQGKSSRSALARLEAKVTNV